MLIKRTQKGNIITSLYESTNILASKYNTTNNNLVLVFKSGFEYSYEGVDVSDYNKLELAESQGKIFNKYIKQYPFSQLGTADIEDIRKRIDEVKKEDLKALDENVIQLFRMLVSEYDADGKINESKLKDMLRMVQTRENSMKNG
jgi:hypothetical protein